MELILALLGLVFIGGIGLSILYVFYDEYKERKKATRKSK